jgi:hypothetical protein
MEMSRATRIRILKKELDNKRWVGSAGGLLQALTDSISEAELMEKVAEGMPEKKTGGVRDDEAENAYDAGYNDAIDDCQAYWASRVGEIEKIKDKIKLAITLIEDDAELSAIMILKEAQALTTKLTGKE